MPPSLTEKKISQDGWVGTIYSYKSDFKEVFEYLEIHRLSPPEAGPEYKTKRDENDTGLEPVNRERLHFREMITPRIQVKIYQHFLSDEIQHYTNYVNGVPEGRSFWWKRWQLDQGQ